MTLERKVIEAILLVAEEPCPVSRLSEVLERSKAEVEACLQDLAAAYETEDRGFRLRQSTDGWRLYTDPECAPWLERFVSTQSYSRLSGAALEALAVVAYRQPVSRTQITEIRGVDSDGVVKTLVARGLIAEQNRAQGPGAPALFVLSDTCLEHLGLASLDELPPLASFMPDAEAVEDMESKLSPRV